MIITAHVGDWVVWTDWVIRSIGEPEIPVLVPVRIEQVYQPAGQAGPVFQISTERIPAGQQMMKGFRHNALPSRWVGSDELSLLPPACIRFECGWTRGTAWGSMSPVEENSLIVSVLVEAYALRRR